MSEPEFPALTADVIAGRIEEVTGRARQAARRLAVASRASKDAALAAMADALVAQTDRIVEANAADLTTGRAKGLAPGLLDRLTLNADRIAAIAGALRQVAGLPDPVGQVVRGSTLPNGIQLRQVRVPMGVVGMIYEARPNVTADAAGLGIKSGNAVILRGGGAAARTNGTIVEVLSGAIASVGLPPDAVQSIDQLGRQGAVALMHARGQVDLLVPRGGAGLIQTVVTEASVPVIETGVGNCHVYVDAAHDAAQAIGIVLNSKTQRPSVCNAAETLLVHADAATTFLPVVLRALAQAGVRIHADAAVAAHAPELPIIALTEEDWATEYMDLDLAVGIVGGLDQAIDHIRRWSSGHTEAICTTDLAAAQRFVAEIDSAVVNVNASTRFTDGGEFGLGAEIGISTQKLHARGPMGLAELTTTKWIVIGQGQLRG